MQVHLLSFKYSQILHLLSYSQSHLLGFQMKPFSHESQLINCLNSHQNSS